MAVDRSLTGLLGEPEVFSLSRRARDANFNELRSGTRQAVMAIGI